MGVGQVSMAKADLAWRGIMGDVVLSSRPQGAHVEDVFVKTSVRRKTLGLEVELAGASAGPVRVEADVLNEKGEVEKTFVGESNVVGGAQTLAFEWPWADPRLWDLDRPNLYALRLRLNGKDLSDEYRQPFGFREFWIEGKRFFLNGTPFNFRPSLGYDGGVPAVSAGHMRGMRHAGHNIEEIWPNNDEVRGYVQFWESHVEQADRVGMPLMGPSTHMDPVASWWHEERWSNPAERTKYIAAYERNLRKYRNHPSILLWANSGNNFGSNDDQEPRHLGRPLANPIWSSETSRWRAHHEVGQKVYDAIRRLDPTRPILFHQSGPIGDVYTANTYLNFLPLQDREEWLSAWAAAGEMPYSAVEFGTPLNASFMRGREGWAKAQTTEPLATEFAAIYLGDEAYRHESPAYRADIARRFKKDQDYEWTNGAEEREWGFQSIQKLFLRNTWRTWRTWNLSGGMVPWTQAHGYDTNGGLYEALPAWKPGDRGLALTRVRSSEIHPFQPDTMPKRPAGVELERNNGDVLAWIAGRRDRWTEKGHGFAPGEAVEKSVVLINDARTPQAFEVSVEVRQGAARLGGLKRTGTLAVGERRFVPIRFSVPGGARAGDGTIDLAAKVGGAIQTDRFDFRVVTEPSPLGVSVSLFDSLGKSGPMLRWLGVRASPWDGRDVSRPLIVGREAMTSGKPLPGSLRRYVAAGGRLLLLAQKRSWLRKAMGFRIAEHLSRRAFPIAGMGLTGVDATDLADWRSASTLEEAYPDFRTLPRPVKDHSPSFGWRWGSQGAVSSAAIEKPHLSGWTPILETEFDLAYSPLMRLAIGKGQVTLCTLDLEDGFAADPFARRVAARVLSLAVQRTNRTPLPTVYLGGKAGWELLQFFGVEARAVTQLGAERSLAIVGPDTTLDEKRLKAHLAKGGRVLFLPRQQPAGPVDLAPPKTLEGFLEPPRWPEVAGLSLSDLRLRAPAALRPLAGGCEIGAGGLLGRRVVGKGVAIYLQIDPSALEADRLPYLRYSRWRQTRAVSQVLTNLGATFKADRALFESPVRAPLYSPDYRKDFGLGDDPYRYFRW